MPLTQEQIEAKIAELTATLQSGVTSISVAGTTTAIDLDAIRAERDSLMEQSRTNRRNRPRISRVNLGGAMG